MGFSSGGIDTSDATATAKNIEFGYTAYARGEKITGTASVQHGLAKYPAQISQLDNNANYPDAASIGDYSIVFDNKSYVYDVSLTKSLLANSRGSEGAATSIDGYAIYAHIPGKDTYAYDSSLTETILDNLSNYGSLASGTSVGTWAIFGTYRNGNNSLTNVDGYSTSLTHTVRYLSTARSNGAAANVGNYGLFAGGWNYSTRVYISTVDSFNSSLTRGSCSSLSSGRYGLLSSSLIDYYAIFTGGDAESNQQIVDVYNTSLTKSQALNTSEGRRATKGGHTDNYMILAGGYNTIKSVEAYSYTLTHSICADLDNGRYHIATTTTRTGILLLAGGYMSSAVDAYYEA